jgi:hypothetical protein
LAARSGLDKVGSEAAIIFASGMLCARSRLVPSVVGLTPSALRHSQAVSSRTPHQRMTAAADSRRTASARPA